MKNKKGLTLIELLAVIAIIAILFVLLIPQISSAIDKSKKTGIQVTFNDYRNSITSYLLSNLNNELDIENINTFLDKELQFTNSESSKLNPYGNPYKIFITDDEIEIYTKNNDINPKMFSLYIVFEDEINYIIEGFEEEKKYKERKTPNATADMFTLINNPDGSLTISGYNGSESDLVLPKKLNGKKIISIYPNAFYLNSIHSTGKNTGVALTSIVLPEGLETIGDNAFRKNNLNDVTFPSTLKSIGGWAFQNNQLTSLDLPKNISFIGDWAFQSNKISTLVIPSSLNTIQEGTFYGNNMKKLFLNNGVKKINNNAFRSNNLEYVQFSSNLESIGSWAFQNNKLTKIDLPNSLTNIGSWAFQSNYIESLIIPNSLYTISEGSFFENKIKNIIFHNNITTIEANSFNSNILESVTLPTSLTNLGLKAFANNNLSTIILPSNLSTLGTSIFVSNPNLKTVINKTTISNSIISSQFDSSPTITN